MKHTVAHDVPILSSDTISATRDYPRWLIVFLREGIHREKAPVIWAPAHDPALPAYKSKLSFSDAVRYRMLPCSTSTGDICPLSGTG
jgi:hypothetical protein